MKIKQNARNLVLYMSFGDGYISKGSSILTIRHCSKQKEYLEWKHKLLKSNNISVSDIYYVKNNGYGAYEFYTRSYNFMKLIRKYMYTPYKKITRKELDKLTPLGIYIWYLDDGSLTHAKNKDGSRKADTLYINTEISKEDNQIIIDYFQEKWGISFKQNKDKRHYRLVCHTKEARKFLKIIEPYKECVNCLKYKFDIKPEVTTRAKKSA